VLRLTEYSSCHNKTPLTDWQKEPRQAYDEASGHVRPERVNKWPNSMNDSDDNDDE
jgi:hypothetical protein